MEYFVLFRRNIKLVMPIPLNINLKWKQCLENTRPYRRKRQTHLWISLKLFFHGFLDLPV